MKKPKGKKRSEKVTDSQGKSQATKIHEKKKKT